MAFNFFTDTNWDDVKEAGEARLLVPQGVVKVIIKDAELKPGKNKSESRSLVQHVVLQVIEGEFKGAETTIYFNLLNKDLEESDPKKHATVMGMTKSQMKSLFVAIGKYPKQVIQELKNIPFKIRTEHSIRSYTADNGDQRQAVNVDVKAYYGINVAVQGEDIPLVSARETLLANSTPATNTVRPTVAPPIAPMSTPPVTKKPPVVPTPQTAPTTTGGTTDEEQPDWI